MANDLWQMTEHPSHLKTAHYRCSLIWPFPLFPHSSVLITLSQTLIVTRKSAVKLVKGDLRKAEKNLKTSSISVPCLSRVCFWDFLYILTATWKESTCIATLYSLMSGSWKLAPSHPLPTLQWALGPAHLFLELRGDCYSQREAPCSSPLCGICTIVTSARQILFQTTVNTLLSLINAANRNRLLVLPSRPSPWQTVMFPC